MKKLEKLPFATRIVGGFVLLIIFFSVVWWFVYPIDMEIVVDEKVPEGKIISFLLFFLLVLIIFLHQTWGYFTKFLDKRLGGKNPHSAKN